MRRTPIAVLVILLIVLIGLGYFLTNPEAGQDVLVEFGLAEPIEEGYLVTGILEAEVTYLAGSNGGIVLDMPVPEGQRVKEGDVLVRMDTKLLEPLLDAAQARYEASQAQLELVTADPREEDLDVTQIALEFAQTLEESAAQALEDAREFAPEVVKDEQVALAQAALDQAQAEVDLAQANLSALQKGASESEISVVEALVEAAEADVLNQRSQLESQTITAPFEGVILETFLLPGEFSLPGQPLLALADLDMLEVRVYIPEADLGWAELGDEVKVSVDAYPDRAFRGEVVHIADQAEFTPRNVQTPEERVILVYQVRIRVANPEGALKPGLPAEITLGVES
jgi:HlyD family secretion protein